MRLSRARHARVVAMPDAPGEVQTATLKQVVAAEHAQLTASGDAAEAAAAAAQ